MGPDHSQIEIYNESKHGVLFEAQRDEMNLRAKPMTLFNARYASTDLCDLPYEWP